MIGQWLLLCSLKKGNVVETTRHNREEALEGGDDGGDCIVDLLNFWMFDFFSILRLSDILATAQRGAGERGGGRPTTERPALPPMLFRRTVPEYHHLTGRQSFLLHPRPIAMGNYNGYNQHTSTFFTRRRSIQP